MVEIMVVLGCDSFPLPLQLAYGLLHVCRGDDGVALEDAGRLPAADLHDDLFRVSRSPKITRCCTSQVMKQEIGNAGRNTGVAPSLLERQHGLAVRPSKHMIVGRFTIN